jgi:hypothetical protein
MKRIMIRAVAIEQREHTTLEIICVANVQECTASSLVTVDQVSTTGRYSVDPLKAAHVAPSKKIPF